MASLTATGLPPGFVGAGFTGVQGCLIEKPHQNDEAVHLIT